MTEPGAPSIDPARTAAPTDFWTTALAPLPWLIALFAFAFLASRAVRRYLQGD